MQIATVEYNLASQPEGVMVAMKMSEASCSKPIDAERDFRHLQVEGGVENYLRRKTVDALARPLIDNDYDDLTRVIRERVVAAAAIIEDGSASKSRNLVDENQKAALDQLQLPDGAATLACFKRHPAAEYKRLRAAIKLPPRPDYHTDNMDLSIVVDRGDVW